MASSKSPSVGFVPEIPRRTIDLPGVPNRRSMAGHRGTANSEGKRLVVGREISLSGSITACETLIVEGTVEATLENSEALEISETGVFRGTVAINAATIAGSFEGTLTVRDQLSVRATGRIKGTVRYGRIQIEEGGQIEGDVHVAKPSTKIEPTAEG